MSNESFQPPTGRPVSVDLPSLVLSQVVECDNPVVRDLEAPPTPELPPTTTTVPETTTTVPETEYSTTTTVSETTTTVPEPDNPEDYATFNTFETEDGFVYSAASTDKPHYGVGINTVPEEYPHEEKTTTATVPEFTTTTTPEVPMESANTTPEAK